MTKLKAMEIVWAAALVMDLKKQFQHEGDREKVQEALRVVEAEIKRMKKYAPASELMKDMT